MARAQAAIEFLMTYGWAILIMLVVLGVLFYLGVFSPQSSAVSSCTISAGFTCVEYRLDDDGNLYLDLGQATGRTITVIGVGCSTSSAPAITDSESVQIRSAGHAVVTGTGVPCLNSTGTAFKGTVVIQYTTAGSSLMRNATATLAAPMTGTGSGSGYGSDLVLLMHFDNNPAIGENASMAVDSSSYARNGTINSGASWNPSGKLGSAMQFDGVNGYVNFTDSPSLNIVSAITIEAWVKQNATGGGSYEIPVSKQGSYFLGARNKNDNYSTFGVWWGSGGSDYLRSSSALPPEWPDSWHLITGTYDGAAMKLYLDGVLNNSLSRPGRTIIVNTNGVRIGRFGGTDQFCGLIDEVRAYNRALTPEEILAHYQVGG